MSDNIINFYYFANNDLVTHVGFVMYDARKFETEEDQISFLKKSYASDLSLARHGRIPAELLDADNGITIQQINSMMRKHDLVLIFSDLITEYNLPLNALHLITPVVNGSIKFEHLLEDSPLTKDHIDKFNGQSFNDHSGDYILKYSNHDSIDFGQLLKDDHFSAIHLLFNNGHYLSAMKLILSFIDTVAWIDIGEHHNFIKWMNTYSDLNALEITAEELWELRNSLLHMTNLDSQKVRQGKVRRISFSIQQRGSYPTKTIGDTTFFNMVDFLFIVEAALSNWVETYNSDRKKIYKFVERYDRIARH